MYEGLLSLALAIFAIILAFAFLRRRNENLKHLPLPPGPPPLPLLGNFFDMPQGHSWKGFSRMSEKYGDVMHLRAVNQHIIIVSSVDAAADLFEKRGTIYSDRYQSVMLNELMDVSSWAFGLMNYGEEWRKTRKITHQELSPKAIRAYDAQQLAPVRDYLKELCNTPEKFFEHTRFVFAATVLKVIYGIQIKDASNKHAIEAETGGLGFNQAIEPGRFWVDFFPFLKYVPAFFPGATFKKLAAGWGKNMANARDHPFFEAKDTYVNGLAKPSAVRNILERSSESDNGPEEERLARNSFGVAFTAGVGTSAPTVLIYFYAMMAHPEVQKKAQKELDAVVGRNRLPTLEDRKQLPYIEAILKETLRWCPVTPLATPHCTAASDEYRGYYIPKGSIVMGNAWHMLHDPIQYPNPHAFQPERYLNPDGTVNTSIPDPDVAFGFGRRICPGRFLSMNAMFLAMAGVLHTFDITAPFGSDGKPIIKELQMSTSVICHPEHFPCIIRMRDSVAELLTG